MRESGFTLIDKAPRPGSRGTTVFFVHPKSRTEFPFGFLIEMVEDGCNCDCAIAKEEK